MFVAVTYKLQSAFCVPTTRLLVSPGRRLPQLSMKVGWDEAKRRTNLRKHGLNFADAEEAHEQTLYFENI